MSVTHMLEWTKVHLETRHRKMDHEASGDSRGQTKTRSICTSINDCVSFSTMAQGCMISVPSSPADGSLELTHAWQWAAARPTLGMGHPITHDKVQRASGTQREKIGQDSEARAVRAGRQSPALQDIVRKHHVLRRYPPWSN